MILNNAVKKIKRYSHRGDQTITTDLITSDIVDAISDSRRDIIKLLPKDWLRKTGSFATVSGTALYSLASDVQEPLLFRYTTAETDYFPKKIDTEREFYQLYFGSTIDNNRPTHYFDSGVDGSGNRQIQFFPTPDAAYTINYVYYKDPTTTEITVADLAVDIPDVPSYCQDVLWKGGLYYFLKGFDDVNGQTIAKADFEQAKLSMEIADNQDLDNELSFRFDTTGTNFVDPTTGIRLV